MGEVKSAMSLHVVRSQALCLLERLALLEPGGMKIGGEEVRGSKKQKGTGLYVRLPKETGDLFYFNVIQKYSILNLYL